jgi:hypothetical protein
MELAVVERFFTASFVKGGRATVIHGRRLRQRENDWDPDNPEEQYFA